MGPRDPSSSELRMLIQILGKYPNSWMDSLRRESLHSQTRVPTPNDPDPGLRASCEWYLRRAGKSDMVNASTILRINPRNLSVGD